MISFQQPAVFNSRFTIVSCFVEYDGKILLLHRQDHKPEGDTWGVPAGKVEQQEDLEAAIKRELEEETSIVLNYAPIYIVQLYVSYPTYDFIYHIFRVSLLDKPIVHINQHEHKGYQWITPHDALSGTTPLIGELDACIAYCYPQ